MPTVLWVVVVLLSDLLITCVLLRWIPAKHERWICATPFPLIVALTLTLRYAAGAPWPAVLAACAGFVWGILLALLPFRGWVSSWALPVPGEARLRWREVALVVRMCTGLEMPIRIGPIATPSVNTRTRL
jgi:hypothetical protein